jgi:hypothetical protein
MNEGTNGVGRIRPLAGLQVRLESLEKKLKPGAEELLARGREAYESARSEWQRSGVNSKLTKLTSAGQKRLRELLDTAEAAGSRALGRVAEAQDAAVRAVGVATHGQIEDLTRRVKRLTKRVARTSRQVGNEQDQP